VDPDSNGNADDGQPRCTVASVTDGDTIVVEGCADAGRVRLILIDTPEVYPEAECFGPEAAAYTVEALQGRPVVLERDGSDTDRFGRYLRYVWLDGELFNERIVRDGYSPVVTYPPDLRYLDRMRAAEAEARTANRGLWSPATCGGRP